MKKAKLLASLFLLAALLILSLAACGKEETETKTEDTVPQVTETAPAEEVKEEIDPLAFPNINARVDKTRYEDKIASFESEPIEEGKILFYGSSGFTRWTTQYANKPLEEAILSDSGEQVCINHGFGGATAYEMAYYYERAVKPWNPKALVMISFINDRGVYQPKEQIELLRWICDKATADMPDIHIYISDYRPTGKLCAPSDIEYFNRVNDLLCAMADERENVTVYSLANAPMYYTDPQYAGTYQNIDHSIFIEDNIHFTPEGYDRFAETMREFLAAELAD